MLSHVASEGSGNVEPIKSEYSSVVAAKNSGAWRRGRVGLWGAP